MEKKKKKRMRAGIVPSSFRASPFHVVVTAGTSAVPSILSYRDPQQESFPLSGTRFPSPKDHLALSVETPLYQRPLLISHLLPSLWSELVFIFQQYTSADKSYTFSAPGFPFLLDDCTASATASSDAVCNAICFHILERTAGDFTPNNMVYHTLQQPSFSPFSPPHFSTPTIDAFTRDGSGDYSILQLAKNSREGSESTEDSGNFFYTFLRQLQEGEKNGNERCVLPNVPPGGCSSSACSKDMGDGETEESSSTASTRNVISTGGTAFRPSPTEWHSLAGSVESEECTRHNQHALKQEFSLSFFSSLPSSSSTFFFFPHRVSVEDSIPYYSSHFAVLVNLKPVVPYHLLIVPIRCIGSLQGLRAEERADFGNTMSLSIRVLNKVRRKIRDEQAKSNERDKTLAFDHHGEDEKNKYVDRAYVQLETENYAVAVQQGKESGQTVPHLHFHLLPFDRNGRLTATPEADEEEQQKCPPRTGEMMREEAKMLRSIFAELQSLE